MEMKIWITSLLSFGIITGQARRLFYPKRNILIYIALLTSRNTDYNNNNRDFHTYLISVKYFLTHVYLTPVKTQLLQYNLTRDLMLFYHSVKIKA